MGFESVLDFTQVILYSLDLVRVVQEYHASIKELPTNGKTFWQKDSLITHILFELWPIMVFRPVANFAQQSLND